MAGTQRGSTVDSYIVEFFWENAAAQSLYNFVVVQAGPTVLIYQVGNTVALSSGLVYSFNIEYFAISGSPPPQQAPCQFASGYGYLFITHPYCYPMFVTYTPGSPGTFTVTQINMMIRDFTGVDDSVVAPYVITRPEIADFSSAVFDLHTYNLLNQGWGNTSFSLGTWNGTSVVPEYAPYLSYLTDFLPAQYPSNADVWWSFKDEYGDYNPFSMIPVVGSIANSPAPQGHFILNALYQDRATAVLLDSEDTVDLREVITPVTSGYSGPGVCAFYAGRFWCAGIAAPNFNNQIFYSQIIQTTGTMAGANIGYFYQSNDPTASDLGVADLVDSDGGILVEPEMGQIYKMYVVGYSLMIFCSNGTWAISGSSGTGFKATDFSVTKVSNIAMVSQESFIDADGIPMWWNTDGIYTVSTGGSTATGASQNSVVSMTDTTIQTFFNAIPSASLPYVKGSYNRSLKTIYWLFTSSAPSNLTEAFQYDSVLTFNTLTKTFSPWTLPFNVSDAESRTNIYISGLVTTEGLGTSFELQDVTDQYGYIVYDNSGNPVETYIQDFGLMPTTTFFFTQYNDSSGVASVTWSVLGNAVPWMDFSVNNYDSFATSGYSLEGQAVGKFQSPYLLFYLNTGQETQINIQTQWNFANTIQTGKISSINLLQDEGGNYDFKAFRRKVRGVGRSLQVNFSSVEGQYFEVAGWAIEVSTNTGA